MIKSELVQIIAARNPHLFLRDVENIVGAIFDEITEALAESRFLGVSLESGESRGLQTNCKPLPH